MEEIGDTTGNVAMVEKVGRCSGTRKGHDVIRMTRLEPLPG